MGSLVMGSFSCARETLKTLRVIVSHGKWNTVQSLIDLIKFHGCRLVEAQPIELAVGNVVRRVLHLIREEYMVMLNEGTHGSVENYKPPVATGSSLYDILGDRSVSKVDYTLLKQYDSGASPLKPTFIQGINELMDEVDNLYVNVANQAIEHIHSNEIIMTMGRSKTVEEFLKAAHRKLKFQVIVAENAPLYTGQELALSLSQAGIETTLICDSAIYAVMSRVNKVILGTHAVLANGGLIAQSGSHLVAAAARYHHIPVVVCTGLYKLSPLQPFDEDSFKMCVKPDPIMSFSDALMGTVDVLNHFFDYVAPEFVNLFVTNSGGHPPSYIYRLLSENYHHHDYRLDDHEASGDADEHIIDSRPSSAEVQSPVPAQSPHTLTMEAIEEVS
eukprot:Partr_v1_DN26234_c1_g1_i1_m48489 putative translation INITIATION FACTOR